MYFAPNFCYKYYARLAHLHGLNFNDKFVISIILIIKIDFSVNSQETSIHDHDENDWNVSLKNGVMSAGLAHRVTAIGYFMYTCFSSFTKPFETIDCAGSILQLDQPHTSTSIPMSVY